MLNESLNGFVFESNRGTKHNFEPDTKGLVDFVTGTPSRPASSQSTIKNKEVTIISFAILLNP